MRVWSIIFLSILTLCSCTGDNPQDTQSTAANKGIASSQQMGSGTGLGISVIASNWQPWRWQPVNDTAVDQCFYYLNMTGLIPCTSSPAHNFDPKQDGMVGLDVTSNTASDGRLGFSFMDVLPSTIGPLDASFHCVYDQTTGLMWQRKGWGFYEWHDEKILYTHYTDTYKQQVMDLNTYSTRTPTQAEIEFKENTTELIKRVNTIGMCNLKDWRLPTQAELLSLYDFGKRLYPNSPISGIYSPALDTQWFKNLEQPVHGYGYWTSTMAYTPGAPISEKESHAMLFSFNNRSNPVMSHPRSDPQRVILVRGNPF